MFPVSGVIKTVSAMPFIPFNRALKDIASAFVHGSLFSPNIFQLRLHHAQIFSLDIDSAAAMAQSGIRAGS